MIAGYLPFVLICHARQGALTTQQASHRMVLGVWRPQRQLIAAPATLVLWLRVCGVGRRLTAFLGLGCTVTSFSERALASSKCRVGLADEHWLRFRTNVRCPDGMAISGIRGQADNLIHSITPICQDNDLPAKPDYLRGEIIGSAIGKQVSRFCSGEGAITGFYGKTDQFVGFTGRTVASLGAICTPTRLVPAVGQFGTPVPDAPPTLRLSSPNHIIPSHGPDQSVSGLVNQGVFDDSCGVGEAMVGVEGAGNQHVVAIAGLCAPVDVWTSTLNGSTTQTPLRGGDVSSAARSRCPQGTFVIGLDMWSGDNPVGDRAVLGVRPICRRLGPTTDSISPGLGPLDL